MGPGFIDAKCPKCRAHVGWFGKMVDRPACSKCGHQVPKAELEAADAKMAAFEADIPKLRREAGEAMRQMFIRRGIGLREGALKLRISATRLSSVFAGREQFTVDEQKCFEKVCVDFPPRERDLQQEREPDYGGTLGADGQVHSDADPGL